ncbi:MAG: DUF5615 family PIN-like protein, partial [Gammaproteobacteria bacterium]
MRRGACRSRSTISKRHEAAHRLNLSPRWVPWLAERGHTARHWLDYGSPTSTDTEIMAATRASGEVVVTNDLDFGTLLALSGDDGPS